MTKNLLIIVLFAIFLQNCSTLKEGFQSKRKNSTDEFLVEKKQPLVMPPNYNELPEPSTSENSKNENKNFKKLVIKKEINIDDKGINNSKNKNTENFILDKIKKN